MADLAAAFAGEEPDMHPQIANSFISLLATRDRTTKPRLAWLRRLLRRA